MRHVVGGIHGEFSPKHGSVQITLLIYYLRSLHLKIFIDGALLRVFLRTL